MTKARPIEERFWEKADRRGTDDCWPWTAATNGKGYGIFKIGSRITLSLACVLAHRLSYKLSTGIDPRELDVRHSCDNPICVNPAHLTAGTTAENMNEMVERGRSAKGEKVASATLTEEKVIEIRTRLVASYHGILRALAREYGVDPKTIRQIRDRLTWRHIT